MIDEAPIVKVATIRFHQVQTKRLWFISGRQKPPLTSQSRTYETPLITIDRRSTPIARGYLMSTLALTLTTSS